MHEGATRGEPGTERRASDLRAKRRQSFRGARERLCLLAERESDESPAEIAVAVEARSRHRRDADVCRHPFGEEVVRRVAQRGEIGENVIGALWEREEKSRLGERPSEQIAPFTVLARELIVV